MAAWFRQKRYGYGARPASWQGRLLSGGYLAFVAVLSWLFLPDGAPLAGLGVYVWLALVFAATAALIWITYRTTDGGWRWRWGGRGTRN